MDKVFYSKFSRERRNLFQIQTVIGQFGGRKAVRKIALHHKAEAHIQSLKEKELLLKQIYPEESVKICPCVLVSARCAEFPFLSGITLERLITEKIEADDFAAVYSLAAEFWSILNQQREIGEFQETDRFREVFGEAELPSGLKAAKICNLDMVLSNLLKMADGQLCLIDYEWVFDFPVPLTYVYARSLMLLSACAGLREEQREKLYSIAGIESSHLPVYMQMEIAFQQYVSGKEERRVLAHLYPRMHKDSYRLRDWDVEALYQEVSFDGIRIDESRTELFRKSYLLDEIQEEITVPESVTYVRFALRPGTESCVLKLSAIEDEKGEKIPFTSNAALVEGPDYYFVEPPVILIENTGCHRILIHFRTVYRKNGMIGAMTEVKKAYNERFQQLIGELNDKQNVLMEHVQKVNEATQVIAEQKRQIQLLMEQNQQEHQKHEAQIRQLQQELEQERAIRENMLETKVRRQLTKFKKESQGE